MVHFPEFARTRLCIYRAVIPFYGIGFPHSVIPGSMPACGSPRLIAACHDLHRLLLPRHPPCALSSLTTKFTQPTSTLRQLRAENFMALVFSAHRFLAVLRTAEAPADSKALIKNTLSFFNSRLVVTQCYSVVKNHPPFTASHLGGLGFTCVLPKVRRQATARLTVTEYDGCR